MLTPSVVERLTAVAAARSTWHVRPVVLDDTLCHHQRFERLQREIREAADPARSMRRIRGRLIFGGIAAVGLLSLPSVSAQPY